MTVDIIFDRVDFACDNTYYLPLLSIVTDLS
jgi:hypothetical protein